MKTPLVPNGNPSSFEVALSEPHQAGPLIAEALERGYVLAAQLLDNSTPAVLRDNTFTTLHRTVLVFVRAETVGDLLRRLFGPLLGWPLAPSLSH